MHENSALVVRLLIPAIMQGDRSSSVDVPPPSSGPAIAVTDNGVPTSISISDIVAYHAKMEAEEEGTWSSGHKRRYCGIQNSKRYVRANLVEKPDDTLFITRQSSAGDTPSNAGL